LIVASARQHLAVRTEGQGCDRARVAWGAPAVARSPAPTFP